MGGAWAGRMHRLIFVTKRFWLGFGRMFMPIMQKLGLTPARYDFMLAMAPWESEGVSLPEVRTALGVSRTAVSNMARLLEERGLIERACADGSKRMLTLRFTKRGRKIFRRARYYVRCRWFIHNPLENCFTFRGRPRAALGDVIADLEELAFEFDDRAELEYPSIYPEPMRLLWHRHDHDVASGRHPLDNRWRRRRRCSRAATPALHLDGDATARS